MNYTEKEIYSIVKEYNKIKNSIKDFNYKKNGMNFSYKFLTFYFDYLKENIIVEYSIYGEIVYDKIKIKDLLNYMALNEEVYNE